MRKLSDILQQRKKNRRNLLRLAGFFILLFLFLAYQNRNKPAPKDPNCVELSTFTSEKDVRNAVENCWQNYIFSYDTVTTRHFNCRLRCRNIKITSIYYALKNGKLANIDTYGCKDQNKDIGKIEPCLKISGQNENGAELIVVVALKTQSRKAAFITAYLKKGKDECETDCNFKR